jgi:hypothetical protein
MDEQTSPTPETPVITPDPVVVDTPVVEPPQAEPAAAPAEPVSVPETPQTEVLSEPLPESPTAQMGRNEPLKEAGPQGPLPFSKTDDRQENLVAPAEVSEVETPTPEAGESPPSSTEQIPSPQPSPVGRGGDAGTGIPIQQPETQQGTAQPESTPESTRPPLDANSQGRSGDEGKNIVGLILIKARLMIQLRKQKKLLKIMPLFVKKNSITNDDVEKLLHVSDATATRYLSELEKQGKITQTGKTGHAVTYTKV